MKVRIKEGVMHYFFVILALVCQLSNLGCLFSLNKEGYKEGIKTKRGKTLAIISMICQIVALVALICLWLSK